MGAVTPDTFLSQSHITGASQILPIYADMFSVCVGGIEKTRSTERAVAHGKTCLQVSSVGRFGVRPSTVTLYNSQYKCTIYNFK